MIGGGVREEWRGEGLIEEKGCGGKERERERVEGIRGGGGGGGGGGKRHVSIHNNC